LPAEGSRSSAFFRGALLLAALAAAPLPAAAARASDTGAEVVAEPIVVAERPDHAARRAWRRGERWGRNATREIERAARETLEALDPSPLPTASDTRPRRDAAPAAPGPELGPEFEPDYELEEPVMVEPERKASPAKVAPPAPPPASSVTVSSDSWPLALVAAALLAVLSAALLRRSRSDASPSGASADPAALAVPRDADALPRREAVTRPRPDADRAVADAIAAAEPQPFPGDARYEVLGELGRGGMGVVYRAHDKRLDRSVALKRLPDSLSREPRYVELLLREARSAARLSHRHIVTIYDVEQDPGGWFITMELLEGSSLAQILRQRGKLGPRAVCQVAEQALAGLGYAHARGVIHRDVKPANLFVTRDRTLKLMDFGVAKIAAEARRQRTIIGGTPDYMAPEQATGGVLDGRADLYALGATLFELLTGRVPFADGDPLPQHQTAPPPDPRTHDAAIPADLAALVLELLAKDPNARPASAEVVLARIRAIAAGLAGDGARRDQGRAEADAQEVAGADYRDP
jgi:hypothetical protein